MLLRDAPLLSTATGNAETIRNVYCGEQKASVHVAVIVPEGLDRAIDGCDFLPFIHVTVNPALYT